ncbi:uncharacterized protein LOC131688518 isoform X2 [Topomyia yanbarensis]|uniref:uncharacterized protein LOC131688518 isoform X2 n=1 Tax=Topomyia yanbarensis TaxID=2498891 RepID=UPI00273B3BD9|nr:uncharacterized protein LOC131688518 isoform X2 [Topomyia yanbarensis]
MDCQMFLIVGDDRHRLKEGITLIGSAENDRYSVIRLQDGSVCPKHAAIRCTPTTRDAHVIDLCSHAGTLLTDDRVRSKRIPALEWHKIYGNKIKLAFGTTVCQLEISNGDRKSNISSASFFDGSIDSIDCSLDEAPQIRSRLVTTKQSNSSSSNTFGASAAIQEHSVSTSANNVSITRESFIVPSTQQIADRTSLVHNSTSAKESRNSVQQASVDDDDDLFYIPETQECIEQANESEIIGPISNTGVRDEKEDDFLPFETEDDENTGDGLFNNPYVEQSQDLVQNLEKSNKTNEHRKSIQPDRSVDSISFRGKLVPDETDEDLSKIEWNDSKATSTGKVGEEDVSKEREGSVTPDILFDRPESVRSLGLLIPQEGRVESVTPDLEFDRITPQQPDPTLARKLSLRKDSSESLKEPVLDIDDVRVESVTPDLDFEKKNPEEISEEDPYLQETQFLAPEPNPGVHASTSAYDLATQLDPLISGRESSKFQAPTTYDVLTQKLPGVKLNSTRSLQREIVIPVNDLRRNRKDISIRVNKEIELDPFLLATQPLPVDGLCDVYDLQTQPLGKHADDQVVVDDDNVNDTVPLLLPVPSPPPPPSDDIYDLQTQLLEAKGSYSSLPDDDPEMSKLFRPPVNSTCRQSVLVKQIDSHEEEQEKIMKTGQLNISPSSNKENQDEISQPDKIKLGVAKRKLSVLAPENEDTVELSQSDEEYCLAATMPITEAGNQSKESNTSTKKTSRKKGKSVSSKTGSAFKVPDNRSVTSSTKSSITSAPQTPHPQEGSGSEPFDFNTPEHPFLNVVKKEKILAVSDMLKSHTTVKTDNVTRKYKYIFGDSSDEDQEPNEPVFVKKDSKIQVMKYDKEEKAEVKKAKVNKIPERRSKRDKKKTERYSDDEEDSKSTRSAKSKSSRGSTRSIATDNTLKPKVDESVDYQPLKKLEESTKTRKRKAAEEPTVTVPVVSDSIAPKASKSKKSDIEAIEPKAGPSKSDEQPMTKRSSRLRRAATEEIKVSDPSKAVNKTVPTVEVSHDKKTDLAIRIRPSRRVATTVIGKLPTDADEDQAVSSASEAANTSASGSESSGTRKSSRAAKPRLMFTKMSPEPYRRMITRAASRKMQR